MNRYLRQIPTLLLCAALTLNAASCIYEDMEPCPVEVRFVYDYNMQFADAFPRRVKDVRLYIFGQDGQLLDTRQASASEAFGENYRMDLQGLDPGTYTLVAWATDDAQAATQTYAFDQSPAAGSQLTDMHLHIDDGQTRTGQCALYLPNLWHGWVKDFTIEPNQPALATVSLTQDIKRFRILLQNGDGSRLAAADYSLSITAANSRLDYDNSPMDSEPLRYTPHYTEEAVVDNGTDADRQTPLHALVAEMNTLRLTEGSETRFLVRNEREGRTLFDIDLLRYLELMRLEQYADMPLQEYLDREDSYQIILLLGQDEHVISIQINQWIMVFNETEL